MVASQPSEVTAAGQLDARRPDRSLPQPSRRNRRRHPPSGVTARETSSASVATPDVEAVPSPRLTGRVSTAGDSSPDEGLRRALALSRQTTDRVSAAPTKETTSVDGELELALAMSRQSAARDSLVAGSTDQTASSQIQEMPVAAPGHSAPDQDEDLELALRLSIFGSCVEGMLICCMWGRSIQVVASSRFTATNCSTVEIGFGVCCVKLYWCFCVQ